MKPRQPSGRYTRRVWETLGAGALGCPQDDRGRVARGHVQRASKGSEESIVSLCILLSIFIARHRHSDLDTGGPGY